MVRCHNAVMTRWCAMAQLVSALALGLSPTGELSKFIYQLQTPLGVNVALFLFGKVLNFFNVKCENKRNQLHRYDMLWSEENLYDVIKATHQN